MEMEQNDLAGRGGEDGQTDRWTPEYLSVDTERISFQAVDMTVYFEQVLYPQ